MGTGGLLLLSFFLLLFGRFRLCGASESPNTRFWRLVCFLFSLLPIVFVGAAVFLSQWMFNELVNEKANPSFMAVSVSAAAGISCVLFLFPGRFRAIGGGFILLILSAVMLADLVHWRFFGSLVPLVALGGAGLAWDAKDSALDVLRAPDMKLLLLAGVGGVLVLWPHTRPGRPSWRGLLCGGILFGLLGWLSLPAVRSVEQWMGSVYSWRVLYWADSVKDVGLLAAHARDVARTRREALNEKTPPPEELSKLLGFVKKRTHRGVLLKDFGLARGANLLLVQIEGMQAWVMDTRVKSEPITPFLNQLKEGALYFENLWDQTGASSTSDCEYLVLNSLHPLARGAVAFRRADNNFVALPGVLRDRGYQTMSAHAYARGMWNRAKLHPRYGFERSLFRKELGAGPKIGWGIGDELFVERAVPQVLALQEPWFGFLVTLTSHHPYNYLTEHERRIDVGALKGTGLGGYVESMRYVDDAMRRLFGLLTSQGVLDRTMVVVYGDHDSKLHFGGQTQRLALKELDVDRATLRLLGRRDWRTRKIPLMIVLPGRARVGLVSTVGGQIDIAPTVLHYLGLPQPPSFLGAPLGAAGMVARFDGSAVDHQTIWTEGEGCRSHRGKRVRDLRCRRLRSLARDEAYYSRQMTLFDLSGFVTTAVASPHTSAPTKDQQQVPNSWQ